MGKFSTIAILTDLDRTFLSDDTSVVERNLQAIEYFKSQGGRFSLATGRMHYNLDHIIPGVDTLVNAPAIHCNGTYLYDYQESKVVAEQFMEPQTALAAMTLIRARFPKIRARVSRKEGYLLSADETASEMELKGYGIDTYKVVPFEKWDPGGWYKLVLSGEVETVNAVERLLMESFPGIFEYNRSRATTLEIQMKGTNKASLLSAFRTYLAERGENRRVYVCGDYENDRAILSAADVAVCPSNALPQIKEICDLCLCSNNEGVIADLVEHLRARERSLF